MSKEGMEGGREGERKKVRKKKATSLWLPSNHKYIPNERIRLLGIFLTIFTAIKTTSTVSIHYVQ